MSNVSTALVARVTPDILAMYADGYSIAAIAEKFGIGDETVRRALIREGVDRRPQREYSPELRRRRGLVPHESNGNGYGGNVLTLRIELPEGVKVNLV